MSAVFSAEEILCATQNIQISGYADDGKGRLVWELEEVSSGDWFMEMPGQFDETQNNFEHAFSKGARGIIVNRGRREESAQSGKLVMSVADTKAALLDMLRYWRHTVHPKVVAVGGNSGRRATMVLLNQLLAGHFRTHVAFANSCGWLGCAKRVLEAPSDTQILIFEAGATERGIIKQIGTALEPDLAVLTPVRHPLPSPHRDTVAAALYCEVLETLCGHPKDRLAAVIYDDNPAVQKRSDEVLSNLLAQKYSLSGKGIESRVSDQSLTVLSDEVEKVLGLSLSRPQLWCAVEAARSLGLSKQSLEEILELSAETNAGTDGSPLRQIA
ncbi:MAG TPA: hypothetical protein V6C89_13155 [Drouetiella sp.]|jgi:UDP-N-acetylmuramyl pentapeptide synthase